jgi:alkylresorcinol/alkylpyrone synthase
LSGLVAPHINAIATAVPLHVLHQGEVADRAGRVFTGPEFERLRPVYANAEIETRHSCVPIEWYETGHGFAERNRLYVDSALALLEEAARNVLDRAGLDPRAVDGVVVASTTGIVTPSLDAMLVDRLGLRRDVERLPIFGLGCAAGVLGLARTAALAEARPGSRWLFLVVELCGLTFRSADQSKSNVVATALFGDGAAACLVSADPTGPAIIGWGEHIFEASLDVMGWDVVDDGLKVVFSRDIPTLIRKEIGVLVARFLDRKGLALSDIAEFCCHPGGAKVLDALEDVFGVQRRGLVHSRNVLRRYGNMSAATVLFVLAESLAAGGRGRRLLTALGPGFTAGFLLLEGS